MTNPESHSQEEMKLEFNSSLTPASMFPSRKLPAKLSPNKL